MAGNIAMAMAMVILTMAFSGQMVAGIHHHVTGWDITSDLAGWASSRVFKVGDNIWFDNTASQESLIELESMNEFSSCDLTNPIKMYTQGINRVPLHGEGTRFFVSGDTESCKKGLKLHINVHPIEEEDESLKEAGISTEYKDATNPYGSSEDEDVPAVPEPTPSPKPKPKPPHKAPPPEEFTPDEAPDSPPEPLFPPPPTPSSSTTLNGHFLAMVAAFCWIAI